MFTHEVNTKFIPKTCQNQSFWTFEISLCLRKLWWVHIRLLWFCKIYSLYIFISIIRHTVNYYGMPIPGLHLVRTLSALISTQLLIRHLSGWNYKSPIISHGLSNKNVHIESEHSYADLIQNAGIYADLDQNVGIFSFCIFTIGLSRYVSINNYSALCIRNKRK